MVDLLHKGRGRGSHLRAVEVGYTERAEEVLGQQLEGSSKSSRLSSAEKGEIIVDL